MPIESHVHALMFIHLYSRKSTQFMNYFQSLNII